MPAPEDSQDALDDTNRIRGPVPESLDQETTQPHRHAQIMDEGTADTVTTSLQLPIGEIPASAHQVEVPPTVDYASPGAVKDLAPSADPTDPHGDTLLASIEQLGNVPGQNQPKAPARVVRRSLAEDALSRADDLRRRDDDEDDVVTRVSDPPSALQAYGDPVTRTP
ncbi:MAG: hypothetical protein KC731_38920, partial [Myxococcales bacterium]|nr:hypothetical protein [Myxococcales bacterium]